MSSKWSFEEQSPKAMNRDPIEAEFFTGEEETDEVFGRTDALVRETIQNSLDAADENAEGPVRVHFSLSEPAQVVRAKDAERLLKGLIPHLDELGNDLVNLSSGTPDMSFLAIEDFGTRGLCGDVSWNQVQTPDDGQPYDFYWFWRNVGRSGKTGSARGRWGLGKTVFPATSRINSVFGLTVRSTDEKRLLMGQAITRMHEVAGTRYVPEGFFCDPERSDDLQMPFEDGHDLNEFEALFSLSRDERPGLSIVIPYPFERIRAKELLRSVIVHFFYPIQKGTLEVVVRGPGVGVCELTARSIRETANGLDWKGSPKEKKHSAPPFDLTDWAIERCSTSGLVELKEPEDGKVPRWGEHLFDEMTLGELRQSFDAGSRVAIRVPMTVLRKDGDIARTYFDVFMERDSDLARSDDHVVREGMTISKISTLRRHRGLRGLLVVEDKVLSGLLGDAEGPAHTEWGTGESRPDHKYTEWKGRVTFVRSALSNLSVLLAPPPEGLDEDWLQDIFALEDPKVTGGKKKKGKTRGVDDEAPPLPPLPPPPPKPFEMSACDTGFRIRGIGDRLPERIVIRVAYDLVGGDPFRAYSAIDFDFSDRSSGLVFMHSGLRIEQRQENRLVLIPEESEFYFEVTGFDVNRDVVVSAVSEEKS